MAVSIAELSAGDTFDPLDLADVASNKNRNKFDHLLGDELLLTDFAADQSKSPRRRRKIFDVLIYIP